MSTILVLLPWVLLFAMALRLKVAIIHERTWEDKYRRVLKENDELTDDLVTSGMKYTKLCRQFVKVNRLVKRIERDKRDAAGGDREVNNDSI